ncbi:hypothetical protein T11_6028 [Trichinella zimbabwensis]|uniref:Uncharacterized protein n=1 Tax=Trichinella zimbabwensis TaxID=268475 RepID=A0A0V1I008_9BILA|nr:hypothetical protein T11_6028 [Trichinella zimbabwensis]
MKKSSPAPLSPPPALPRGLPTASSPPSPQPDPPSTDRSLRSAEDVASSPDGSFAP